MLKALKTIVTLITSLFDFVIDTVKGLGDLAVNLLKLPSLFSDIFSNNLIPGIVSAAVVACLALMITLRIIGRDG